MGGAGNALDNVVDNAVAESFFATLLNAPARGGLFKLLLAQQRQLELATRVKLTRSSIPSREAHHLRW